MEIPEAAETEAAPAPEGAPEGAPETEAAPAPETAAQKAEASQEASAGGAAFAVPEEVLPVEPQTPRPKARPKGRPKGSKTVNRRPRATADSEGAAEEFSDFAAAPRAVVETPPDIFEIIRQRQTAQFERRQAFYQSFLPVR